MQGDRWKDIYASSVIWTFVGGVLFGLYLASFAYCLRWLLFEDQGWTVRRKANRTLVITTLVIFSLSMLRFWMQIINIWAPPMFSIAHLWASTIFLSDGLNWSILIVIDSVLIYRCWTVFAKNWFIICFPLALWGYCLFGVISAFYCDLAPWFYLQPGKVSEWLEPNSYVALCHDAASSLQDWGGVTFYVCNTMIGIYTTSAIVYKIWHAAKSNNGTNSLYKTRRILTESGILYTASSASNLWWRIISFQLNGYDIQSLDPRIVGQIVEPIIVFMPIIAFHLITIRVSEQRAREQDTWVDSMSANVRSELPDTSLQILQAEMEPTDHGEEIHGVIDERN